jgi:hypothetical protein
MVAEVAKFLTARDGGKWIYVTVVSPGQHKYNRQKMMSSTKSTIFSSFYKKKQGRDMVLQLMWLRRPQSNF